MAINIESGSTWAEIRRLLNKDSAEAWKREGDAMTGSLTLAKDPDEDMEAANKGYVDDRALFVPGDLYKISLGTHSLGINEVLTMSGDKYNFKKDSVSRCVFFSNGKIKLKFTLNPLGLTFRYGSSDTRSWDSTCRGGIYIKLSAYYDNEDEIVIYEEDGDIDNNSLAITQKTVVIDSFNVKVGENLKFKSEVYIHDGSSGFYVPHLPSYSKFGVNGLSGVHFSFDAYIGNHIIGALNSNGTYGSIGGVD